MSIQSEQLKQGLLLHVEMNRNFVDEKIYKQFAEQCKREDDITTLDRKKILKVIKFLFDFGSNEGMRDFYLKLEKNVEEFIRQQKQAKPKNDKGKVPIDLQNLVELILFCVNNGFESPKEQVILSIKEPPKLQPSILSKSIESPKNDLPKIKKSPAKQQQQKQVKKKQQTKKQQITLLNPQLEAKVDKIKLIIKPLQPIKAAAKVLTRLEADKIPAKVSQFRLEKYEMPNRNVGPKYLQPSSVITKSKPQTLIQPIQYLPLDVGYLQSLQNKKHMHQRLLKIYQHYCSQQQNNGHSATFDKIKSQLQHMNLGKFLIFCSSTGVFRECQKMDKNYLSATFKKQAGGKKEINFDEFERLIEELDGKYIEQMKKVNINRSAFQYEVPTYHSRLRLNTNQGYKQVIKLINLVFFTRDNEGKMNIKDLKRVKGKVVNTLKELTRHSGKFDTDLYQHVGKVKDASSRQTILTERRYKDPFLIKRSKAINMQEMQRQEWPKISWLEQEIKLAQQQSTQQIENSQRGIGRSRKDVVGKLKRRLEEVSRLSIK